MSARDFESGQHRELAHRVTGGVEVVLFWHSGTGAVTTTVSDVRTGSYFEVPVEPSHALDVFEHPYAYAAFAGIPYESELLPSWAETADPDSAGHAAGHYTW
jgi:hypothetical protein